MGVEAEAKTGRKRMNWLGRQMRDLLIWCFPLEALTERGYVLKLRNRFEVRLYCNFFVEHAYLLHKFGPGIGQEQQVVVFDVGANCGQFTASVFDQWPSAIFHAFEPQKKLARRIEEFALDNTLGGQIVVNRAAVREDSIDTLSLSRRPTVHL